MKTDTIGIIYEHPLWHEPLFEMLEKLEIKFSKIDLKSAAFKIDEHSEIPLFYNLVSPSAHSRNNQQAIPYSMALVKHLENQGRKVLNGSSSIQLEMSKSAQMSLLKSLNVFYPKSYIFNSLESIRNLNINYPQILKPEQGGSGSRIYKVHSFNEVEEIFKTQTNLWEPDYLFLLQDEIEYNKDFGIVRLEFIEQELLYAMRVVTHGSFNLCPSVVCNPDEGSGSCEIPNTKAPEFYAYKDITSEIVEEAKNIVMATGHNITSLEFAFDKHGNRFYYDINSNSNLRESVCQDFGNGNPFEKVANYLKKCLAEI